MEYVALVLALCVAAGRAYPDKQACRVRARTAAGWVCGRASFAGATKFASFLGVPYAQQPVGDLRFKELQPLEAWSEEYDATAEGPVCPQHDVLYGSLVSNRDTSEACIHANVHVPWAALPGAAGHRAPEPGLPVLVFVHGGGFAFGSGGGDLHGPEHFIKKNVIVVTFNYRLNVFGFLSLDSKSVPGNNGLRDVVTLLGWLRENARNFGGDPNSVTLAGQSAGAAIAHLLTLSPAAEGLFHRAILMSGTAMPSFYTTSPAYAKLVSGIFTSNLDINETDPEEIHRQLVALPLEDIMEANKKLQDLIGITAFMPVVESPHEGVTAILDQDPDVLLAQGRGSDIPLIIGHTSAECETFRRNFEEIDLMSRIKANPLLVLSPNLIYKVPADVSLELVKEVDKRYFNGTPSMDSYIRSCSDTYYEYPALKVAQLRMQTGGAPAFLYRFAYVAYCSVIKTTFDLDFEGAGHIEDLTFVFKTNSFWPNPKCTKSSELFQDNKMTDWLTTLFTEFMFYNAPSRTHSSHRPSWPALSGPGLAHLDMRTPWHYQAGPVSPEQLEMVRFFDGLQPQNTYRSSSKLS